MVAAAVIAGRKLSHQVAVAEVALVPQLAAEVVFEWVLVPQVGGL